MSIETVMAAHVIPMQPVPSSVTANLDLIRPVRAVLFDIYGTLLISGAGGIRTSKRSRASDEKVDSLLKRYAIDLSAGTLFNQYIHEIEAARAKLKSQGIANPEVDVESIWAKILPLSDPSVIRNFAAEFEMLTNPVYPMPGLLPMLEHLRSAGVVLGLISNAQFFTPHLFSLFCGALPEQLGFSPQLLIYSYEYGKAKPSPLLFDLAWENLEKMEIDPESVLYVGNDLRNDVRSAQEVGFMAALFAGDRRSLRLRQDDPGCKNIAPDLVITHLEQLKEII